MQEDGGRHQMVLVIRTHDPQGRLTGTGLLLTLAVGVHGRKCLSRWSLEQGPKPEGSLPILPEPTSQGPTAQRREGLSLCVWLYLSLVQGWNGEAA